MALLVMSAVSSVLSIVIISEVVITQVIISIVVALPKLKFRPYSKTMFLVLSQVYYRGFQSYTHNNYNHIIKTK